MMVPMGSSIKMEMSLSWFMKMKEGRKCGRKQNKKNGKEVREGRDGEKEARRKRKIKCGRKKVRKRE